jgi:hypothetical protein
MAVCDADVSLGVRWEVELVTLAELLEVTELDRVCAAEFAVLL